MANKIWVPRTDDYIENTTNIIKIGGTPTYYWEQIDDTPDPDTAHPNGYDDATTHIGWVGNADYSARWGLDVDGGGSPNASVPTGSTSISVTIYYRVHLQTGKQTPHFKAGIKSNTTDSYDTERGATGAYASYEKTYSTNPDGGGAWTPATVNAISFIALGHGSASAVCKLTQTYAVVTYTPAVGSESASESASPSASPSSSPSASPSASPSSSISASASESASPSVSPSSSPSSSPSASPSAGYQDYTRGNYATLPTDDADLETAYSAQDITDVATKDDVRVSQGAIDQFAIHQYKDFAGNSGTLEWEGQTNCAAFLSTVYLQIYNRNTTEWETLDSDDTTAADTDFTLTANVADFTNYKDGNGIISSRIYQEAI